MRHLDNAATSAPKPDAVVDAVIETLRAGSNPGRGRSTAAREASALLESARHELAAFVGLSRPERLVFTLNATDSLSLALKTLVPPGSRVLTSAIEHAAVARPLERLARSRDVQVWRAPVDAAGRVDADDICRRADGSACVVMSCASNVTGAVQPFEDVAARLAGRGVPLLLDAAQAAGSVALHVDRLGPHVAVALTGHKALLGPMGVGALVVGEEVALGFWREGGTGDSLSPLQPDEYPRRLEAGTPPLPAIAGLRAGVRWWVAAGPESVRRREVELMERLGMALLATPGVRLPGIDGATGLRRPRVPLLGFLVDGMSPEEVATILDADFDITVRAGLHCAPHAHETLGTLPDGTVRASVGPTTAADDVDALVAAVTEIAAAARS